MANANFIISLDFELKWGIFDVLGDDYDKNILGVREAIPEILELFRKYKIHATWAIVGMLLNENKEEFYENKPNLLPGYKDKNLDPYIFVNTVKDERLIFAPDLAKLILKYPNQEIATHSYAHYNALAEGQNIKEFEEDIKAAINITKNTVRITSDSFYTIFF